MKGVYIELQEKYGRLPAWLPQNILDILLESHPSFWNVDTLCRYLWFSTRGGGNEKRIFLLFCSYSPIYSKVADSIWENMNQKVCNTCGGNGVGCCSHVIKGILDIPKD